MDESSYSRRQLLSTGVALSATALAGCLGEGGSEHGYTSDRPPASGGSEIDSLDELEAPAAGGDLAGTAGGGEPDWIHATSMRFKGWYDATEYYPYGDYSSNEVTLSVVNVSGYMVNVAVYDDRRSQLYFERLVTPFSKWIRNPRAASAKITVLVSAKDEALDIDLTDNHHHEIWLDGAILNASYWVGRW